MRPIFNVGAFIRPLAWLAAFVLAAGTAGADPNFEAAVVAYEAGDYVAARQAWLALASRGDPAAERNIAHLYRNGLGVPQDFDKAAEWYRRAAEKGLVRAQANLGNMYLRGQGVPQDPVEATAWFERAARQGHVISQYNLGLLYETGLGVAANEALALGWYHLAAKAGHRRSLERLSVLVVRGVMPAEVEELVINLDDIQGEATAEPTEADGAGEPDRDVDVEHAAGGAPVDPVEWASPELTSVLVREPADAAPEIEWFSDLVPLKDADDQFARLSAEDRVASGLDAYRARSYAEAGMAWRPLAESGESNAQFYLGGLYFEGAGVPVDVGLAFFWWWLAAESGHLKAGELRDLAERALSGKDRDAILRRAETWQPTQPEPPRAQPAASTPPLPLSMTVGRVPIGPPPTSAGKDQGAPLAVAEASASTRDAGLAAYRRDDFEMAITAWFPLAVDGDRMAQFYVGCLYFDGTGVSASRVQAHLWWSLAAAQGLEMADQLLILLATEMRPTELAQAHYLVDSWSATE
jgi:hypothetical protein